MKLDAETVAALMLGGKTDAIFFDSAMPRFGFRLRLAAGGEVRKQWIVQYRSSGTSRRLLLGPYPILTAAKAREAAEKALAKIETAIEAHIEAHDELAKTAKVLRSLKGVGPVITPCSANSPN